MIEQDVIGHLLDVEKLAYDILLDTQTVVDGKKAEAKEAAELAYRASYETIIKRLEDEDSEGKKRCDDSRNKEYETFYTYLSSLKKDQTAFSQYLDSLLFGN